MESQYIKRSLIQLPGSIPMTDRTLDQIGQIFCSEPYVFFCLFLVLKSMTSNTVHLVLFRSSQVYTFVFSSLLQREVWMRHRPWIIKFHIGQNFHFSVMVLNIILEHVLRQVVIYYLYLIKMTRQFITTSHVGFCPRNF